MNYLEIARAVLEVNEEPPQPPAGNEQEMRQAYALLKQAGHRLPGRIGGRATVCIRCDRDSPEVRRALELIYPTCEILFNDDERVPRHYRRIQ